MAKEQLPLNIQSFEEIIRGKYIYVDKTDLVYRLAYAGKFIIFHRPRGFGKSLLISTLQAYFEGRKDLFRGLKINHLEKEWVQYPVFRFDFNNGDYHSKGAVNETLTYQLEQYEQKYGITKRAKDLGTRFENLILQAHKQTGRKVVILIDDYSRPILETIGKPKLQTHHRSVLKPFYSTLKSFEEYIQFSILSSVTPLGELNFFSDLNFFQDLSLSQKFATLCGFTNEELKDYFSDYISELGKTRDSDYDKILTELRTQYDGYRFNSEDVRVYNPYSILNCFANNELKNYWFATGSPTLLKHILRNCSFDLNKLNGINVTDLSLTHIDDEYTSPIPLLYQCGYLTITDYELEELEYSDRDWYTLGFPNKEIRDGFYSYTSLPLE